MKHHIVFHRADLDGIGSCMVVLRHLSCSGVNAKDIQLHPWNYGEKVPAFEHGDHVYIVDCSFEPLEMIELRRSKNRGEIDVTWIDHHKTAYEAAKIGKYNTLKGMRTVGRPAAIALCYEYFFGNPPKGISLLSDYDTWVKDDKDKWENEILPFQYGMRLEPWLKDLLGGDRSFDSIVEDFFYQCSNPSACIDDGEMILEYQRTQDEITSKRAFSYRFHGITFACLNASGNSNTFRNIPFMYEACMMFRYDGGKWKFSLYATNDKGEESDFDLTEIAKHYGGGGHAKACGFEVHELHEVFGPDEGPAMNTI